MGVKKCIILVRYLLNIWEGVCEVESKIDECGLVRVFLLRWIICVILGVCGNFFYSL